VIGRVGVVIRKRLFSLCFVDRRFVFLAVWEGSLGLVGQRSSAKEEAVREEER
jgi:hypothetical protein